MRLWADVDNAAGNLATPGPLASILRASVTRRLDGAGSFTFELPGTDARALDTVLNKRRANIFVMQAGYESRQIVRGIIDKIGAKDDNGGWRRTVDGPDNLAELKYISTHRGRKYDAATLNAIVDDLLGLTTGWSRSGSNTSLLSVRFDATSILGALQALVEQQGIHFRQGNTLGTIEIGTFGTPNGLRIVNVATLPPDFQENDDVLLIDSLTSVDDSEDLVNWLEPLGAGQGDAMLTLEKSTRTTPYTIQTITGPDGRTIYYIADSTSISTYGTIQRNGKFSDIAAISNSEADQIAAANALYDMAVAWLLRYKDPYRSYSLTVRKSRTNLLPGDKIHLRYFGRIENEYGDLIDFRDINEDFWIMEVSENFGEGGNTVSLKIASVDRYEQDNARIVLGALEEIRVNNVSVEPYFSNSGFVYVRALDDTHSAIVPIDLTTAVARLNRCRIRIVSRPFRATAKSAKSSTSNSGGGSTATSSSGGGTTATSSGGGSHTHTLGVFISNSPFAFPEREFLFGGSPSAFNLVIKAQAANTIRTYEAANDHTHNVTVPNHSHNVTIPAHTHTIPAADLDYGITDDTEYPDTIRIAINGVDRTSALGGPWGAGGVATDEVLEVANYINLAPTLQQLHEIEITCDDGQGEIEVTVELYETIQSISVF